MTRSRPAPGGRQSGDRTDRKPRRWTSAPWTAVLLALLLLSPAGASGVPVPMYYRWDGEAQVAYVTGYVNTIHSVMAASGKTFAVDPGGVLRGCTVDIGGVLLTLHRHLGRAARSDADVGPLILVAMLEACGKAGGKR